MPDQQIDEMVTPAQAARLLNLTPEWIRQLANAGELPVTWTALGRLFSVRDREAFKKRRAAKAAGS
jgi:hypothetical protein